MIFLCVGTIMNGSVGTDLDRMKKHPDWRGWICLWVMENGVEEWTRKMNIYQILPRLAFFLTPPPVSESTTAEMWHLTTAWPPHSKIRGDAPANETKFKWWQRKHILRYCRETSTKYTLFHSEAIVAGISVTSAGRYPLGSRAFTSS